MKVRIQNDTTNLPYASAVYEHFKGIAPNEQGERFQDWWAYATRTGLNEPEYLLPQIQVQTEIEPFTFESTFAKESRTPPSMAEINRFGPWAYQVEFGNVSTLNDRKDADYKYHRYRASLLSTLIENIIPPASKDLSILDVACHCGVFSLELAARGFKNIRGIDLRENNIRQAKFLSRAFGLPSATFSQGNASDLSFETPADVIFCGGLLYHVTFPMELLASLHKLANEFVILDTLTHKYPFSGFFLVSNKNVDYSAEGEFHYEFHPTYRAVCDGLHSVGFKTVYEVIGSSAGEVPNYNSGNVRTFLAAKNDHGLLSEFLKRIA